ncbi:hypothetical protein HUE57_00350 [Candidatus Reidiella endopervernicosa]|uniref:Uncharacterized protein n=1 Tax=Candidatus Reidiella endopervernicosa TaxID=2738883 RepID=A0A6N0I0H2_9GAMM|nr:hypothetical protein HUE57_00350 [Candidatus Reidiella endopervernicosa]
MHLCTIADFERLCEQKGIETNVRLNLQHTNPARSQLIATFCDGRPPINASTSSRVSST